MTNCIVSFEPRLAYSELLSYKYLWAVWDSVESMGWRQHWVANIFEMYGTVLSQWEEDSAELQESLSCMGQCWVSGKGQHWDTNIFERQRTVLTVESVERDSTTISYKYLCAVWDSVESVGRGQHWVANIFELYGTVLSQWEEDSTELQISLVCMGQCWVSGKGQRWVENIFDLYGIVLSQWDEDNTELQISLICMGYCWVSVKRTAMSCKYLWSVWDAWDEDSTELRNIFELYGIGTVLS